MSDSDSTPSMISNVNSENRELETGNPVTHHLLPNINDIHELNKVTAYTTMAHFQAQLRSLQCRRIKLLKAEHTVENCQLLTDVEKHLLELHDLMHTSQLLFVRIQEIFTTW